MDALKNIFSLVLHVSTDEVTEGLSPDNTPAWDSLNAIILVTEIEKAFDVRFTFDEAMAVKNFGEVVRLVRSKGVIL